MRVAVTGSSGLIGTALGERLQSCGHELARVVRGSPEQPSALWGPAWIGAYAARPDSIDPLGRQIRELRARSESLAAFLATVRDERSRADIERLLEGPGSD